MRRDVMSIGPLAPAQPDPAEGASQDEPDAGSGPGSEQGEGVSAEEPAEGADGAPAGDAGSPR